MLFFLFFSISVFAQAPIGANVYLENGNWVSEWMEVEVPSEVKSLHFLLQGSNNSLMQISDVIDPNGFVWTSSGVEKGKKLTVYHQPILSNALSLNRSEAVVPGAGSLLLPNQLQHTNIPEGIWHVRAYLHKEPEKKSVKLFLQTKKEISPGAVGVRVWVSENSFWGRNPQRVAKILQEVAKVYQEVGLNFEIEDPLIVNAPDKIPMDLPKDLAAIALKLNDPQKINLYFMPEMELQSKPVNGLACIGGPIGQEVAHPCSAAVFAGKNPEAITLDQQIKIVLHELGHYLGLHHTQDTGYHGIKVVHDSFEDTPKEITGTNLMDPGIHKVNPKFSPMQKQMLLFHPGIR
jgi:hypothetical protein